MSSCVEVMAIVEGNSEKLFIEKLVAPHLQTLNIFITPMLISKSGQNGGDVKFSRAKNDIEKHLKQRRDTFVTIFIDYYGTKKDWPGLNLADQEQQNFTSAQKAERVNTATQQRVDELYGDYETHRRFIPYIAMYEFEALLFSHPQILADKLGVSHSRVEEIVSECGSPENINNSSVTAPSKRLEHLSSQFKKTTTGIAVAQEIGLTCMRSKCPLFDAWLKRLEELSGPS